MRRRKPERRGVLLLVILSLLVLFLLAGITFIVVTGQFRRASAYLPKYERTGDPPPQIMDDAIRQLIRGPGENMRSVAYGHDLLGDLYGNDYFPNPALALLPREGVDVETGTATIDPNDRRAFIRDTSFGQFATVIATFKQLDKNVNALPGGSGYYNGSVITFVNGPYAGISARIVNFLLGNSIGDQQFRLAVTFELPEEIPVAAVQANQLDQVDFVLNGRQFNGTGAGYDPTGLVDDNDPNTPPNIDAVTIVPDTLGIGRGPLPGLTSLLPNYMPWSQSQTTQPPNVGPDVGGMDESYDAADFQNMFLAFLSGSGSSAQIIPSFHRPALINYWQAQRGSSPPQSALAVDAELLRRVMLRPNWLDHPNFSGSNPLLSLNPVDATAYPSTVTPGNPAQPADMLQRAIDGVYVHPGPGPGQGANFNTWDVDNDLDGVPDSVWVDLGFPPQQTADGRLYKPLFAILCVDLDSRINVNVHGSLEQLAGYYNQPLYDPAIAGYVPTVNPTVNPWESTAGQGFGPADVNLGVALSDPTMANFVINSRYTGSTTDFEPGRVPTPQQLTDDPTARDESLTKWIQTINIGGNDYTYIGSWKLPGLIPDWGAPVLTGGYGPGAYGLPPDYHGAGSIVLNHAGQPLSAGTWDGTADPNSPFPTQTDNDPYEINVLSPQAADRIYESGHWETIARSPDSDNPVMDPRMKDQTLEQSNRLLTTRSFDVPVPSTFFNWIRTSAGTPTRSLPDAVRAVLLASGVPPAQVDDQVNIMLPFEIRRGGNFNLNRWFGQGLDDDGNLAVDDESWIDLNGDRLVTPNEFREPLSGTVTLAQNGQSVQYQLLNDDPLYVAQQRLPQVPLRQAFARNLYCLIMFLKQPGAEIDFDGIDHNLDGTIDEQDNSPAETARGIAQWCVNVIDFRDSDSILTPFEVDLNPYDGWNVDGDLNTQEPNPGTDNQDNDGDGQIDEFDEWTRWVVWGCERPELLITETLAFHDRRTEDRDDEFESRDHREYAKNDEQYARADPSGVPATTQEPPPNEPNERPDQEFDQAYRPVASLYVEFYNPWLGNSKPPQELYSVRENGMPGVALDATTPNGDPVWRVIVMENLQPARVRPGDPLRISSAFLDPDDAYPIDPASSPIDFRELPDGSRLPFAPDRSIFFTNVETANPRVLAGFRAHYYRPGDTPVARPIVPPGSYGVAGPQGDFVDQQGEIVNPIGLLKGARVDLLREITNDTRKIKLRAVPDPNVPARYGVEVSGNYKDINTGMTLITPDPTDGDTQPPVGLVVNATAKVSVDPASGIPRPINPDTRVFGSALAVSDPLGRSYDERAVQRGAGSVTGAASSKYPRVMDIPLDDPDDRTDPQINYDGRFDLQLAAARNSDRLDNDTDWKYPQAVRTLGTTVNFKRLHLQRLANPLVPFDPVTNPYRTIDSAWVDLTVYNGLVELEGRGPDGRGVAAPALDYDGEIYRPSPMTGTEPAKRPGVQNRWHREGNTRYSPFNNKVLTVRFRSRQRGDDDPRLDLDDPNNPNPPNYFRQLWRQAGPAPDLTTDRFLELSEIESSFEGRGNRHNFPFILSHSLGFASNGKSPPNLRQPDADTRRPIWGEQRISRSVTPPYAGLPDTTFDPAFPWLVWNNRPFANAMELLQVPYASSSRLLQTFAFPVSVAELPNPPTPEFIPYLRYNHYVPPQNFQTNVRSFFGHLVNFFNAIPNVDPQTPVSPQLARLFDFVEVPSLFEGVDKWYAAGQSGFPTEFQPPFHHLSRLRRPGMINLNTIADHRVWDAMMFGNPGANDPRLPRSNDASIPPEGNMAWNRMIASRRGYDSIVPNDPTTNPPTYPPQSPMELNPQYPTRFANPFRAAAAAELMPNVNSPNRLRKSSVEATLLRPMALRSFDPTAPLESLFEVPRDARNPSSPDLLLAFNRQYDNADRNSYFHYYTLNRLGSIATTHSNCFAVWVTVGYFEVLPWQVSNGNYNPNGQLTFDEGHPDGWTLGQEIDRDVGKARRHRAFYMIDRSIPVGYQPGQDLNAWDTVVLRRIIE